MDNSTWTADRAKGLINRFRRAMPASRGQWQTSQGRMEELVSQIADLRKAVDVIATMRENLFTKIDYYLTGTQGGWCTTTKAHTLTSIILALRPAFVVEIGVWTGRSLIPMAIACRENNYGKVMGIDPYKAAASVDGQPDFSAEWWGRQQIHDEALQTFRLHAAEFGVSDFIDLHIQSSNDVDPPAEIGLLHVDGNHGPQAQRDVERFAPNVHVGGFVVLDDVNWVGGAVSAAAEHLLATGFVHVRTVSTSRDDWALFQRRQPSK